MQKASEDFNVELYDKKDGQLRYEVVGEGLDGWFWVDPLTDEIETGLLTDPSRSREWTKKAKCALKKYLAEVGPETSDTANEIAYKTIDTDASAGIAAFWSEADVWPDEQDVADMRAY